uniref:Bone morphogenetic protein 7 B n=1 Tax=Pinctada fucata TaxID=50426 RepID=A0A1Z1BPI9_PINFU|nr:bone morphogenetic protein 7 B [Pinctada fucata]
MRVYEASIGVMLTIVQLFCCPHKVTPKPVQHSDSSLTDQRIEVIKQKILSALNYTTVPSVSSISESVQQKRKMIQMYREHIRQREDATQYVNTEADITSYTLKDSKLHSYKYIGDVDKSVKADNDDTNVKKDSTRIRFNVDVTHPESDHNLETRVHMAKLGIFKHVSSKSVQGTDNQEIVIKIFQIQHQKSVNKLLQSRIVDISRDGWEIFDITNTVQDWIDNPDTNYGLEIHTDHPNTSSLILPSADFHIDNAVNNSVELSYHPVLEFQTHERSILKRAKRQDSGRRDCTKGDGETRCCRFKTRISFREIGWNDWIIAPEGFDAYYCDGECPYRFKMASNFAAVQSVLHMNNPTKYPKLCCVPSKLTPLTILHKDDKGRYMFTDYPDLVVQDCKCS